MANIQVPINPEFPDVYQWELEDDVIGGPDGIATRPIRELTERTAFLKKDTKTLSALHADMADGTGRDLRLVFGIESTNPAVYIPQIMAEIRRRCNNSGEIDNTGIPDFRGLMLGDYIDGISLDGIAVTTGGTAPQAWNDTYKNNRVVIAGFNTYKSMGYDYWDGNDYVPGENDKNHILFVFRNVIAMAKMNQTNTNTGGYAASELRTWLEGQYGIGDGVVATKLKQQLGGEYLCTICKYHSTKGGSTNGGYTLWIPSEIEIFGVPCLGDEGVYDGNSNRVGNLMPIQIPLYQRSYEYRIKRRNGYRDWYWTQTPSASSAAHFCGCCGGGDADDVSASAACGVAPAFCVA